MKKNASILILFVMGIFSAFSQMPKTLSYQGNVSDASGPLSGTYALTFRIYDSATGGGMLWSETNDAVPIVNGNFSIILGKSVSVDIEANTSLWLGITVGTNPEVSPRVELTGSLYALGMALPYKVKSSSSISLFSIEATGDSARAGEFIHSGVNAGQAALFAISTGGGSGLVVNVVNPSNSQAAININHSGTGNALTANRPIQATDITATGNLNAKGLIYTWPAAQANGVLTNNGSGGLTWAPGLVGWGLTGSSGTVEGTNFIGTTDLVSLSFRVNNQKAGRIDPTSAANTFFGYLSGNAISSGSNNTALGYQSLSVNSTSHNNTAVGFRALSVNTGSDNTAVGMQSLLFNSTGVANTALGHTAMHENTTGNNNSANGSKALFRNTTGNFNSAFGAQALSFNTTGSNNTATGFNTLVNNTIGTSNVAMGESALARNTTGSNNIAIGSAAGLTTAPLNANTTGSNNTFIGNGSGPGTTIQLTNASAIGYRSLVSANNALVLGGTGVDAVKVGIGVTAPVAFLDVAGNVKISDGTQGLGKMLTSDSSGLASWQTSTPYIENYISSNDASIAALTSHLAGQTAQQQAVTDALAANLAEESFQRQTADANFLAEGMAYTDSHSGWSKTGDAGTIDGTNFIGTSDNIPLNFRVNNSRAGRIDPTGQTFLGYQAGLTSVAAINTGIGYQALFANTTGNYNTANGYRSLLNNITGSENTALGYNALYSNTDGVSNTGIGFEALRSNTTGSYNTAGGNLALDNNTSGRSNTAIGRQSLTNNTLGNFNTAMGLQALFANTTGTHNTALGFNAFALGETFSNSTAIGYNAQVTASNMVRIGADNITSINGAVAFTVISDARFKKDINENVEGLSFILKLRPVTYHFDMDNMARFMKTPDSLRVIESENAKEKVLQTGFIAQEVEKIAQELGYDFSGIDKPDNDDDYYGLRYAEFTVPLVKAVQEQQKMIGDLQAKIKLLEKQGINQEFILNTLKSENSLLKSEYSNRLEKLEEALGIKAKK
ncbi:MAG: tail fiber domain-containing protein [Cyclobacteriaceae bacterium]